MEKLSYIYKATCLVNGKIYIGQSVSPITRIQTHIRAKQQFLFHRAISKYGVSNFEWEIINVVPFELANQVEKQTIQECNSLTPNGYNVVNGGNCTTGIKHSEEWNKKIGDGNRGKKRSAEIRKAISDRQTGKVRKPHSLETKLKIARAHKGKKLSPEHAAKCRIANQGRRWSETRKNDNHWIIKCPNGSIVETNNLAKFCRENNLSLGSLHAVLRGINGRTQHKGYKRHLFAS